MSNFTHDELLEVERQGWDSLRSGQGGTFYGELMTPDAVMVLTNGTVMDREAIAGSLDDAPPWATYQISDPRLVDISDNAAALVYRAEASREGDDAPFVALMSSVYHRIDGEPRLALYQQTPVP